MRRTAHIGAAFVCCCALGIPHLCTAAEHAPPLMHAQSYAGDEALDLAGYWVSEKLDGVRAYWNGKELVTRSGHAIAAPAWFTAGWPWTPMDGELWGGRGTFERTSGIVRRQEGPAEAWRTLTYHVFDLPSDPGTFDQRVQHMRDLIESASVASLALVEQERVSDLAQLKARLAHVEARGGEGLMLHRGASRYVAGRTDDLLKFKSFDDAEAKVIGYVPGSGKYAGMLGAIIVERADGARFKIGSGFSDAERRAPPPLGSWITYAYNGLTESGLPRFARFLRRRLEDKSSKVTRDEIRPVALLAVVPHARSQHECQENEP
jgi:DNA ligase-1